MVNGEVVLPLSPDMDTDMPSTPAIEARLSAKCNCRSDVHAPVLARTTRRSLAFLGGSDDPTDGLFVVARPVGVTGHPMRIVQ